MKKKKSLIYSTEDYINEYTSTLASETLKLFQDIEEKKGLPAKMLHANFIAKFMAGAIFKELKRFESNNAAEEQELAFQRYMAVKDLFANGIANAFETSLSKFSGKPVEYYCLIKTVPKPKTKVYS